MLNGDGYDDLHGDDPEDAGRSDADGMRWGANQGEQPKELPAHQWPEYRLSDADKARLTAPDGGMLSPELYQLMFGKPAGAALPPAQPTAEELARAALLEQRVGKPLPLDSRVGAIGAAQGGSIPTEEALRQMNQRGYGEIRPYQRPDGTRGASVAIRPPEGQRLSGDEILAWTAALTQKPGIRQRN